MVLFEQNDFYLFLRARFNIQADPKNETLGLSTITYLKLFTLLMLA